MTTTATPTPTKVRKPNKAEVMKQLVALRREQMEQESKDAKIKKQQAHDAMTQKVIAYLNENKERFFNSKLHVSAGTYGLNVTLIFDDPSNKRNGDNNKMPPEIVTAFREWESVEEYPHGWRGKSDAEIRKIINEEIAAADTTAVIEGVEITKEEEMPVVHDYLKDFLASLSRTTKARERLLEA